MSGLSFLATAPAYYLTSGQRLMGHIVKKDILRMHAPSRLQSSIQVKEVSNIAGTDTTSRMEDLQRFKVIVTTW